ncbi:MAG: hypothetical protein KGM97_02590, partial [Alphaproteobacteria bacterium]|nr:hypothetical protein [Alphaproteobacteria bacterium]
MTFIPYYRRDSKKPKRDLFDKITLGVAIAGNIILAITAVIIGWQSYETRRAVNVSVNNLRPILIYEMTAAPVLSGNIPSTLHVHVEAQNVWQAPAVIRAVKIGYSVSPTFECSKLNRMTGKEEWPFDGKPTRFSFP